MKQIFLSLRSAVAAVVAVTLSTYRVTAQQATPVFVTQIPPGIPRLEVDLRGPRRGKPSQHRRRFGQRCSD